MHGLQRARLLVTILISMPYDIIELLTGVRDIEASRSSTVFWVVVNEHIVGAGQQWTVDIRRRWNCNLYQHNSNDANVIWKGFCCTKRITCLFNLLTILHGCTVVLETYNLYAATQKRCVWRFHAAVNLCYRFVFAFTDVGFYGK